jgi:antitoxin component YwqK of YwqJK toxin-antitoxin module
MMRHILTSMVFVVLLFPSLALGEEVTIDDLIPNPSDGLYYQKFTDVPFSGKVTGIQQGKIKKGKMEGPWVSYYYNGQLSYKGTWKNGKREGPWVRYYDDGQLYQKGNYKNGKKEGPWVGYSKDGSVWKGLTGTFKNDKKVD